MRVGAVVMAMLPAPPTKLITTTKQRGSGGEEIKKNTLSQEYVISSYCIHLVTHVISKHCY